jgi:hypothetical protein
VPAMYGIVSRLLCPDRRSEAKENHRAQQLA